MKSSTAILWVRNDFRLSDNLALSRGIKFSNLLPVFIWNESEKCQWKPGGASKWWLHQSLSIFKKRLQDLGSNLIIVKGLPHRELLRLAKENQASTVLWNRSYDPSEAKKVYNITQTLKEAKINVETFSGSLLCPPEELLKKDGSPYLVYTPFWRNFLTKYKEKKIDKPRKLPPIPQRFKHIECQLTKLSLLPNLSWHESFHEHWSPGENEALKQTRLFLKKGITSYNFARDIPAVKGTSKLSPYLHFGEIHPQRILWLVVKEFGDLKKLTDPNLIQFCKEIVWREFSYHLLNHFPKTPTQPLRESFNNFPWKKNKRLFTAWSRAQTGYPIVDAGMRQLWKTGWMHNRVRMITASFLVKHLGIPWQDGARWFWDTLVDADLASNTQGWQWTAGCGADAQPFFRIFNPMTQGEKFDPEGEYVSHWCPELSKIPPKWIYRPWEASKEVLDKAGVTLGKNYPKPIVNHKEAREKALWNYELMKK